MSTDIPVPCPQIATGVSEKRGVCAQGCLRAGVSADKSFILISRSLTSLDRTLQCYLDCMLIISRREIQWGDISFHAGPSEAGPKES